MFKTIISKIRQVMYKLGLIQGIKQKTDLKDVMADDDHYKEVELWRQVYSGKVPEWHDITYKTIAGEQTRTMQSMKMGKVVASEMANLVFNEKCSISVSELINDDGDERENDPFSEFVDNVLKENNFNQNYQNYLEYMFALGGKVIKGHVENDKIKISYVTADCFIPIAHDGRRYTEGIFVDESRRGDKYYTLLEYHIKGESNGYVIRNELYQSQTKGEIGVKVPLEDLYPSLEDEVIIKNLENPIFTYTKPNLANNLDLNSHLGISIFADALDTIKTLDIMFDSFQREFRLGKKRILLPSFMIKTVNDIDGKMFRYFDDSDETYEAFKSGTNDEDKPQDISVELRWEEHVGAINAMLEILASQTGFSPGTFTFDERGMKTATEVVSENSKTFRTRSGHITIIEESIKDIVGIIVSLAELYGLEKTPDLDKIEVKVNFDDSIAEDRGSNADYWIKLVNGRVASKILAIQKIHKVTEEDAQEILKQINEENATMNADDVEGFNNE